MRNKMVIAGFSQVRAGSIGNSFEPHLFQGSEYMKYIFKLWEQGWRLNTHKTIAVKARTKKKERKEKKKNKLEHDSIQTHVLCDTSAVLYKMSFLANWEFELCEFIINP